MNPTRQTGSGTLVTEEEARAVARIFAPELERAGWTRFDPESALYWRNDAHTGPRPIRNAVLEAARTIVYNSKK